MVNKEIPPAVAAAEPVAPPPHPEERPCPEVDYFQRQMNGLLEISDLVGSVMELDDILEQIVDLTARLFDTSACSIYMLGPKRENLTLRAAAGVSPHLIGAKKLPLGRGLPGIAAAENRLVAVEDASKDKRHTAVFGSGDEQKHAYICAPLRIQEQVVGVMTARRYGGRTFSEDDCTLFETICKQVAIVIEKSQLYYEKLQAERLAAISISLSEVAHYIKNLLQGMKGGMYFVDLGLKKGDHEHARKGWEVLQRGNKRIASLVENMLNYSREMKLNLQKHNVNSVIYEILHQIDDSAVERGVALIPETYRDLPVIEFDYDRVYDALLNLISNAIDAIPPERGDGVVLVTSRVSEDGKYVEVEVKDNGIGMSEEVQAKLFNLFFSTKGVRGSGIGLSVTRKVMEQHKGKISFETREGKGTTFRIHLPVSREKLAFDPGKKE
ncbi:GAF domain-containing sensor histidine kinase [bacterium]|nr:GAF domain-containing sensor histidine kinase [bacterium]